MSKTKHNLLATADAYVQQIAREYRPRNQFAFEQQLSDAVVVKSIYSDDVDICFSFEVDAKGVDVYCNLNNASATGYVYNSTEGDAAELLKTHFGLVVDYADGEGGTVYFAAMQQEEDEV